MKFFLTVVVGLLAVSAIQARFIDDESSVNLEKEINRFISTLNDTESEDSDGDGDSPFATLLNCLQDGLRNVNATNREVHEWLRDVDRLLNETREAYEQCEGETECNARVMEEFSARIQALARRFRELSYGWRYAADVGRVFAQCFSEFNPSESEEEEPEEPESFFDFEFDGLAALQDASEDDVEEPEEGSFELPEEGSDEFEIDEDGEQPEEEAEFGFPEVDFEDDEFDGLKALQDASEDDEFDGLKALQEASEEDEIDFENEEFDGLRALQDASEEDTEDVEDGEEFPEDGSVEVPEDGSEEFEIDEDGEEPQEGPEFYELQEEFPGDDLREAVEEDVEIVEA